MFKDYITEFYKQFRAEFEKHDYIWVACDVIICKLSNNSRKLNIKKTKHELMKNSVI